MVLRFTPAAKRMNDDCLLTSLATIFASFRNQIGVSVTLACRKKTKSNRLSRSVIRYCKANLLCIGMPLVVGFKSEERKQQRIVGFFAQ
jgi:hypothetical protein